MPKISHARKDARRRQILKAAIACFAKRGFQDATIADICNEAGLSAGAVYVYFDSKDAIVAALAESGRELAMARKALSATGESPTEQLKALIGDPASSLDPKISRLDLRMWAEAIGNRHLRTLFLDARKRTLAQLVEILRPLAADRGLDEEALAGLVLAVMIGCEATMAISPKTKISPVLNTLYSLLDHRSTAKR